jgi:hypothetical protein
VPPTSTPIVSAFMTTRLADKTRLADETANRLSCHPRDTAHTGAIAKRIDNRLFCFFRPLLFDP